MEKIQLRIPESWDEVTLGQYIEFLSTDFNELEDIKKFYRTISIICDISEEYIKNMSLIDINNIIYDLNWINEKPKNQFKPVITIDKQKYGSIPNFNQIKVGEWLDLENYMSDFDNNLHKILAIIYRPVRVYHTDYNYKIEDYNSETLEERSQLFYNNFKVSDAMSASVFFWNFVEVYIANLQVSFQNQMKKEKKLILMDSLKEKFFRLRRKKK